MMSKKDQESINKVYAYLKQQNRPYSINDIFQNLHKDIGKTAVQKALDSLIESGSLKEKAYGKQKVYVVNQDIYPAIEDGELRKLDTKTNELTEELKARSKELSEFEAKNKTIESSLTTEEAENKIKEMENEIIQMEESLSQIATNGAVVSQQERERIEFDREKKLKEWKKRRRMALDILDAILEGYPKSKKELYEDIGIEIDADIALLN